MCLSKGNPASHTILIDCVSIPEIPYYSDSALVLVHNGHYFCTGDDFHHIYEVEISKDGKNLKMIKQHPIEGLVRDMSQATIEEIDYLFVLLADETVHIYRIDESALRPINSFYFSNAYRILWLRERGILLVAKCNCLHIDPNTVLAVKFTENFFEIQEEITVIEPKSRILTWIEISEDEIAMVYGKNEFVYLKIN